MGARVWRWRWVILLALAAALGAVVACGGPTQYADSGDAASGQGGPLPSAELEAQAYSIDRSLMCPVCPGKTIDAAEVALARQMRELVREQLAEGRTRSEILQFFVDRYGESVLAAPPKTGFNLLVWVLPPVGLVGGALLLYLVVRAMQRRDLPEAVEAAELEAYMDLVDRDLGRGGAGGSAWQGVDAPLPEPPERAQEGQ